MQRSFRRRYKKRRTATAALPQTSTSLPDLLQAAPPTVVTEAPVDLPASPAFAPEFGEPEVTGQHSEARHQEGVEVSTQTSWTSEPQDQGVLMISCVFWTGVCEASTQVAYLAHKRPTTADVRGERYLDLGMESKLLLFLVKMKHGLTFSALGVLFGIHRTSASRIFYTILDVLYVSTQGWIQWFSRDVVHASMPASFRSKYPNCRVIVDCSEVRIEKPSKVSDRVNCWSNYKSDFTLKFLVGITPSGYITFISDVYGGRASDTYIIANSRLVNLLEPGDMVMADKGFPHVKCDLESKDVTLVMPPFARANEQFTEAEMKETYKVASHRIHVERCIQRIKSFAILNQRLTPELKCHIDKILHVCSMLANLQGPVIKTL
ncbi:uncharacterized protein LOC115332568 [Ixodes scapularis]|uniref:uncharacterized protein LOC115332568 n=1 Tax=Ixodes scapularis TaxID=6945 RepID=UPI001A9FFF2C|nr:uncharacterized protein LOC115332568 [Ixodes scapularis]